MGITHALTIHQPWASFIAAGRKRHETRSWPPPVKFIGKEIAIHAGKTRAFADEGPFGAVVAVARISSAFQVKTHGTNPQGRVIAVPGETLGPVIPRGRWPRTDAYGDWNIGRWIWCLSDVRCLISPVPMKGRQKLWQMDFTDAQMVDSTPKQAARRRQRPPRNSPATTRHQRSTG